MIAPVFVKTNRGKQKNKVKTKLLSLSDWDLFEEEEAKTTAKVKRKR